MINCDVKGPPGWTQFQRVKDGAGIKRAFLAALEKKHDDPITREILNILRTKCISLIDHKMIETSAGPPLYLFMVRGEHDGVMIDLAKRYGMPRGWPIMWWPPQDGQPDRFQTFGFYPKFANDDRQAADVEIDKSLTGLAFFKKFSGFLGQFIVFIHDGELCWTVTSKNSADCTSEYVQKAVEIFGAKVSIPLLEYLVKHNLHLCAEVMAKTDQTHGARVLKDSAIITMMAEGKRITKGAGDYVNNNLLTYKTFREISKVCHDFGLDCGSAIVVNGTKCQKFVAALKEMRDFCTDKLFNELVVKLAAEKPESDGSTLVVTEGTITHGEILGDILEGLVFHQVIGGKPTNADVMKAIETGNSSTVKFKFPGYTVRTMLLRMAQQKELTFSQYFPQVKAWANRWCISAEGKKHWSEVAMQAWSVANTPGILASYLVEGVGHHILATDAVIQHPSGQLVDWRKQFESSISLIRSCTVCVPGWTKEEVDVLVTRLKGLPMKTKLTKKDTGCLVHVLTIPVISKGVKPSFVLPQTKSPLSEREKAKLNAIAAKVKKAGETDPTAKPIPVADEPELLEQIRAECGASTEYKFDYGESSGGGAAAETLDVKPSATEMQLRDGSKMSLGNIMEFLSAQVLSIVILVGPPGIGKSCITKQLESKGLKVCSSDHHMKKRGGHEGRMTPITHKECQADAIVALLHEKSVVIDNTSITAWQRTIYFLIARLLGVAVHVEVVSPEMWLTCDESQKEETIQTCTTRVAKRYSTASHEAVEFQIGEEVIRRMINDARRDMGKHTMGEWVAMTPPAPKSKPTPDGVSVDGGVIRMRSDSITTAGIKCLKALSGKVDEETLTRIVFNKLSRDGFVFHVTILSPQELRAVMKVLKMKQKAFIQFLKENFAEDIAALESMELRCHGNGAVKGKESPSKGEPEQDSMAYFAVFGEWPEANAFRMHLAAKVTESTPDGETFELDPMDDYHTTVGFTVGDVFGPSKGTTAMEAFMAM